MIMKDDYLWDGTGEPDADIEQLEELLGRFRHQAKAPEMPLAPRRFFWPRLAAAAAIIVVALAGLWVVLNRQASPVNNTGQTAATESNANKESARQGGVKPDTPEPLINKEPVTAGVTPPKEQKLQAARKQERRKDVAPRKAIEEPSFSSTVALVNFETASYLESAQMLLRSFRNINSEEATDDLDVSYEKERSRELLYKNILLRRDAEAKGNQPVGDLLSSVEPLLLEIANLPSSPAQADVRSIQERIEKKEIIATIQVYSAPILGANFKQR
jgi:hypothetical protein